MLNDRPPPAAPASPITPANPPRRQSHRRLRRKPAVVANRAEVYAFILAQRGYRQHAGRPRKDSTDSSLIRLVMERFVVSRATAKRHIHDARERQRQLDRQVDLGTRGLDRGLAAGYAHLNRTLVPVAPSLGAAPSTEADSPTAHRLGTNTPSSPGSAPTASNLSSGADPSESPSTDKIGSSPPSKSAHEPRQEALSLGLQELTDPGQMRNRAQAQPLAGVSSPCIAAVRSPEQLRVISNSTGHPSAVCPPTHGSGFTQQPSTQSSTFTSPPGRGLDAIGLREVGPIPSGAPPLRTPPPANPLPAPTSVVPSEEIAVLEEQLQAMLTCTGDAERNPSLKPLMNALLAELRRVQRGR